MAAKKPAAKKPAAKSAPAKPAPAKGGDLASQFAAAAAQAKNLKERPDNDTMLRLYALYKQGAAGDVSGPRPAARSTSSAARSTTPGPSSRARRARTR